MKKIIHKIAAFITSKIYAKKANEKLRREINILFGGKKRISGAAREKGLKYDNCIGAIFYQKHNILRIYLDTESALC